MRTIAISAVAVFVLGVSFAADEPPATPAEKTAAVEKRTSKTLKASDVAKDKKLTPEEREAKIAEKKLKQQERLEARKKVIEAKMLERDKKAAEKAGVSLEEYRQQREAKRKGMKRVKAADRKPMPGAQRVETPVCNGTSCELPSAESVK